LASEKTTMFRLLTEWKTLGLSEKKMKKYLKRYAAKKTVSLD